MLSGTCVYKHAEAACYPVHVCTCMQRPEDSFQKLFPSFYHVGRRDQTDIVRFGDKHLYPLSHLSMFLHTRLCITPFQAVNLSSETLPGSISISRM